MLKALNVEFVPNVPTVFGINLNLIGGVWFKPGNGNGNENRNESVVEWE